MQFKSLCFTLFNLGIAFAYRSALRKNNEVKTRASSHGYMILVSLVLTYIEIYSTQATDHRLQRLEPQLGHHQHQQLTHSEWSPWGSWSMCSSTCGGGAAFRVRSCFRFSQSDGCPGEPRQYKACSVQDCPAGSVDFRAQQCSLYNNKPVLGSQEQFQWFPFYGATNPCDLTCIALGYNFYYTFGRVLDGTRCSADLEGLCINGQCLEAGCDGVLGSSVQKDVCGHCGGQNDTCIFIRRIYQDDSTVSGFFGYKNVTRIPAGATLVKVTDQSKNYLAVIDSEQHYVINGNWAIDWPGEYEAAGTKILYKRSADSHETLEATGPTLQDIYLMVLLQEANQGIVYEYWLPNDNPSNVQGDASPLHQYETDERPVYTSTKQDQSSTVEPLLVRRTESQPDFCNRCKQPKGKSQRIREYCHSDFVFRVKVVGKKVIGQETRYDVQVKHTYKNNYLLIHREYIWVSNVCDCPRILEQHEYLMMAQRHVNFEHTLNRILLRHNSYVKLWSAREDMYLRDIGKHCPLTK